MAETKQPRPWEEPMPDDQFAFLRDLLAAPSPIGLEAAMTEGVFAPRIESFLPDGWALHRFRGNAGVVVDSAPDRPDAFSVMVIGHADKIRMQVRSIGSDGKIWVNSESFLPTTLIGHQVRLFSEDPERPGTWRVIRGGTIEAIGAIHFAPPELRNGQSGIKPEKLYLELQLHGDKRKKQVEQLGIRPGDPILLDRPIERGFAPDTFGGAYLDNGLGCFLVAEVARLLAASGDPKRVRFLGAAAAYEEIGRFGSRVLAREFAPDVVLGVDVNHDYDAAPGVGDKRYEPIAMGKGPTLAVGAVTNAYLNSAIESVALELGVPTQRNVCGRDTGTDAMAGVLASIDAACGSIGFPIRNMHTISEVGHTGDLIGATHLVAGLIRHLDAAHGGKGAKADDLRGGHPRLQDAEALVHRPLPAGDGDDDGNGNGNGNGSANGGDEGS